MLSSEEIVPSSQYPSALAYHIVLATMSEGPVKCLDPRSLGPPHPSGVFSNITTVHVGDTNFVTIAGQIADSPTGETPSTIEEQIAVCLSKLKRSLEAVHGTVHHLTRLAYYMVEHVPETTPGLPVEQVLPWLEGHKPASCYLVVKALSKPEYLCEFEAQAVVPRQ